MVTAFFRIDDPPNYGLVSYPLEHEPKRWGCLRPRRRMTHMTGRRVRDSIISWNALLQERHFASGECFNRKSPDYSEGTLLHF